MADPTAVEKLMECVVCKELMRPPIFVCTKVHSICSECKPKLEACPLCNNGWLNDARNYGLERLADLIKYPCKNNSEGCKVNGLLLDDAIKHEASCEYSTILCPCEPCTLNIVFTKLMEHILSNHRRRISSWPFYKHSHYFVKCYGKSIFKVVVNYKTSSTIFSVLHVCLPDTKSKFKCTFTFEDQTNSDEFLEITKSCDCISAVNPQGIELSDEILNRFVREEKIWYKMSITDVYLDK